jgi:hypothetical protein
LFDQIPDEYFRLEGAYVDLASDWALMLPMAELARSPRWIRRPLYLHEPGGVRDAGDDAAARGHHRFAGGDDRRCEALSRANRASGCKHERAK